MAAGASSDLEAAAPVRSNYLHASALVVRLAATVAWDRVPTHRLITNVTFAVAAP